LNLVFEARNRPVELRLLSVRLPVLAATTEWPQAPPRQLISFLLFPYQNLN
jgi:hypothetical protein